MENSRSEAVRRGWENRRLAETSGYKVCNVCKKELQLSEFYPRKERLKSGAVLSNRLRSHCKKCLYELGRNRHIAKRKTDPSYMEKLNYRRDEHKKKVRAFIQEYLQDKTCVDCGYADWRAFHFDHVRGKKEYNISTMTSRGMTISKIKTEIAKCDIRCANCHLIKTRIDCDNGKKWPKPSILELGERY